MKVLEEFWYGNINPMERPFQSQRKFDKVFRLLTKNEEELLKNLNEQEKELFDKVKACYMRTLVPVRAIAECTGYKVEWDDANQTVIITGEMEGLTIPDADIPGYYSGTETPDFGVCFNIAAVKAEKGAYTYNDVTGKQVIEYIETYLASAGFLIDTENEIFGMFIFTLSNNKTQENVRVSYTKSDKTLIVTLSNG